MRKEISFSSVKVNHWLNMNQVNTFLFKGSTQLKQNNCKVCRIFNEKMFGEFWKKKKEHFFFTECFKDNVQEGILYSCCTVCTLQYAHVYEMVLYMIKIICCYKLLTVNIQAISPLKYLLQKALLTFFPYGLNTSKPQVAEYY